MSGFTPARHKCGQPNVDEDELAPPVPPVPVPPARPSGEASSDVSATHSDTSAPRSAGANWGGSLWSKLKESVATGAAKRTSGDEASHAATPPAAEGDKRDSGDHAANVHENGNSGAATTGMWGVWSKLKQQIAVATTKNNEDEATDPDVPIAWPDKPKTIDIPGKTIDYRVSRVVILCKDCGRDVGFYPARHKCGQPNVDEDELAPPVPPVPVPPARPSGEASSDVSATHSDTSAPRSAGANWGGSLWSKLKESVATGAAKRTSAYNIK
ncbi:hypothetical protein AMAG_18594 [Allomyces macrogynus ATCC 38327]|uniref:Uncharacterized protein n=1 Tax=Allomyces macrogynus (strain ATCC 38327) TaxID=578462 RepID=A0A0L0SDZ2_ALLM3|nr:hypothetical protein AMAG_18594 [Allomyces macrogynus ATCC 38327]|eukprot:KNE60701.1 hypothetical protein AMAG_18594 [Allomyces macrogynus ATCC 38327]